MPYCHILSPPLVAGLSGLSAKVEADNGSVDRDKKIRGLNVHDTHYNERKRQPYGYKRFHAYQSPYNKATDTIISQVAHNQAPALTRNTQFTKGEAAYNW